MAVLLLTAGALLVGTWFMLVSPERKQAQQAAQQLSQAQSQRDSALAAERSAEAAKSGLTANVDAVNRLQKAVPATQDVSALLHALEATAIAQGVDFRTISSGAGGSGASGGSAPASSGGSAALVSGPTSAANGAVGKANAAGQAAANANPGATPSSSAPAASSPAASTSGAGAGSFPSQTFNITVAGSFVHLHGFLNAIHGWTTVNGANISVAGPLLNITSVTLNSGSASGGASSGSSGSAAGGMSANVTINIYNHPATDLSPSTLLAQLQPQTAAPAHPVAPAQPATAASAKPATAPVSGRPKASVGTLR
jgi:type VI secretion system secreted protein VgrG